MLEEEQFNDNFLSMSQPLWSSFMQKECTGELGSLGFYIQDPSILLEYTYGQEYQRKEQLILYCSSQTWLLHGILKYLMQRCCRLFQRSNPSHHRLYQDNDPKHTSRWAQWYFSEKGINWWRTPAESRDINPIELVWGSMKEAIRNRYKPRTLPALEDSIKDYWKNTITPGLC